MSKLESLSIFFPAYNDEFAIGELVNTASRVAQRISRIFEIIVIDDGSTDNTLKVLRNLRLKHKYLKIVHHAMNRGYGGALRSGFRSAKYKYVFYTDGDGQYDPTQLSRLAELMLPGVGMVNGKKSRRDDHLIRRLTGGLYATATRVVFRLPVHDPDCDFRLIRKDVLRNIQLSFDSGAICLELVVGIMLKGYKIEEVAVSHYSRKYGKSQFFKLGRISRTLLDILRLWFRVAGEMYFNQISSRR